MPFDILVSTRYLVIVDVRVQFNGVGDVDTLVNLIRSYYPSLIRSQYMFNVYPVRPVVVISGAPAPFLVTQQLRH